jgi:cytochrome c biogenesis protein CcdA
VTYYSGFGYLIHYNLILAIPLVAVLWVAANKLIVDKMQLCKRDNIKGFKFWAGVIMVALGILIFFI